MLAIFQNAMVQSNLSLRVSKLSGDIGQLPVGKERGSYNRLSFGSARFNATVELNGVAKKENDIRSFSGIYSKEKGIMNSFSASKLLHA